MVTRLYTKKLIKNQQFTTMALLKNINKCPFNNFLILKSGKNTTLTSLKNFCSGSIPKNVLEPVQTASTQMEKGTVYDKKPFKMTCEAGKKYSWCTCGKSKSQPLCDGTHKNEFLKIKFKPVRFQVDKTKEYYICNCKQTNNRPFCDGSHKSETVQSTNVKVH